MADITLSSGSICKPYRSPWGAFPVRSFGVSTGVSSAAIYAGRPVTQDFTLAGNTSNAAYVKGSTADAWSYGVGIAAETISGSTAAVGTAMSVYEANPLVEFSAATKGGPIASSLVGMAKDFHWDSTLNIAWVQVAASTAGGEIVVITDIVDTLGDTGGRVAFRFLSAQAGNIQGSSGLYNSTTPLLAFYR